jgi:Tfp pilus assembly protein PilE
LPLRLPLPLLSRWRLPRSRGRPLVPAAHPQPLAHSPCPPPPCSHTPVAHPSYSQLAIREEACGGAHADTLATAEQLAKFYRKQKREADAARINGKIAEWRAREADETDDPSVLREVVPFPLGAVPKGFSLQAHIQGHRNHHLRHIENVSGALRVALRIGSDAAPAALAPTAGEEAVVAPPAATLHVHATSAASLHKAKRMCEQHLAKVHDELSKWRAQPPRLRATRSEGGAGAPSRASSSSSLTLGDFLLTAPMAQRNRTK